MTFSSPVKIQRSIAIFAFMLFAGKLLAWWLTHSVAILTDALESIVNVITGLIGLYSVVLAARPRDHNHPYGHGKIEFVSASIEGALIILAGLVIIFESVVQLMNKHQPERLDYGIIITAATGVLNYLVGAYAVGRGKAYKSATIQAAGKHLVVDAYSTFAIILGLILLYFTGWYWLDSVVALVFACAIIVAGFKVLRQSLGGIMDETDEALLKQLIDTLQQHRQPQWVDLHNMRVIQYGTVLHVDAHMTLPWYIRVVDADREIHNLEALIREHFGTQIELFVHIDACRPFQCKLCAVADCPERKFPFEGQVSWTETNLWENVKHGKPASERS